jgi:hypothetical protein
MIISAIKTTEFIYLNLHAEEVITSNFIEEDNRGIFEDRLQIATFVRVVEYLKTEPSYKNIIFDFNRINACQPNLNKIIFELKTQDYKILFLNLKKSVCDELALTSIANKKNVSTDEIYSKYFFFDDDSDIFTEVSIDVYILFDDTFKERIKEYIYPHEKAHTSSYVYLTSYVDIKKFLSYEKELMLFSLYKLALKIHKEWPVEIDKNPILICQSMNSAYIVSVLSNLLKLDILILDKIGPVYKIYNRLDITISENRKYIVVSDLVCLGTEVKIVKSLIQFMGGKFLGNVSIIKTETLRKSDILHTDATIAVFSIKRSNNKELGYNITTDLEQLS